MQITTTDMGLVARVQNLSKSYGTERTRVDALRDISVGIRRGEFTAIMGPSGSGKSTLMHIMAGLDAPTSGKVWLGDSEIGGMSDAQLTVLRRRRVGFVFQSYNLVPTLDVEGNLLLPFELDGRRPTNQERAWIDELESALGLTGRLKHRPHELSGDSSSASRSPARSPRAPSSCSPTSPPATSTRAPGARCWGCCRTRAASTARASRWSPTTRSRRASPTA